jgi:tetraacyldisaccharide 4'-kinase
MSFIYRLAHTIWRRQSLWPWVGWIVLVPFSLGFSALVRGRNLLYSWRILSITHSPLKVISVGNLTVGGTGKTPLALWLARALKDRGYKVGILSRGYRGKSTGITVVGTTGQPLVAPDEVGDEAVMLARDFHGVVIAGRDRIAAAQLAHDRFGLEAVILDDSFQHRRLGRDLDLLLINSGAGRVNGWLLPAGPLREPCNAARRADFIIMTKTHMAPNNILPNSKKLFGRNTRPVFHGDLIPIALVTSTQCQWQELPLTVLGGKCVVALTGIADPTPFYQTLREWGAEIAEVMEFPDHHTYTPADWQAISQSTQRVDLIVTTEKDLVKLERFPFAAGKLVALRVQMRIDQEEQLLAAIEHQLHEKRLTPARHKQYGSAFSHQSSE